MIMFYWRDGGKWLEVHVGMDHYWRRHSGMTMAALYGNHFNAIFTFSIHTIGEHAPDIQECTGSKTDSGTN
ncbi:hypothetical protein ACFQ9Y_24870 [Peribacillus simplex]|uniref:hypothetical protein n=1 Tax=Peribacillus simplex TaxID=1478 RepID=UPI00366E3574